MPHDKLKRYSDFLGSLANDLDIPPSTYRRAVKSYKAVGEWLDGGEYEGSLRVCFKTPHKRLSAS